MPQPIQLRRSTVDASTPATLLPGEPAVTISATNTRMWLGDGTSPRLVLSTNPVVDNPRFTAAYLRLAGGTVTGPITFANAPTDGHHLVNRDYVDQQVAAMQLFMGAWDVATNTPNLTTVSATAGQYWIASTGGLAPAGMPGLAGTQINPGDMVVWNGATSLFERIPGGGMTQAEGDARFVQLGGSIMNGALILYAAPTGASPPNQAATKGFVEGAVEHLLSTVHVDGTSIDGDGRSTDPLHVIHIDGGTF